VPDQNTIREFREKLTKAELFSELFAAFNARLTAQGSSPARARSLTLRLWRCRATQPPGGERGDKMRGNAGRLGG